MKHAAAAAVLVFCLAVPRVVHAQLTINFDTDPLGNPIASGSLVNTTYAPWGVQFVADENGDCGGSTNVYASNDQPAGFGTSPNVVTPCAPIQSSDFSENDMGVVRASFAFDATTVCISVAPLGQNDTAVVRALDESDNVLDTTTSTGPGVTEDFCVNGSAIRAVEFAGEGDAFARFDTLVIFGPGVPTLPWPGLLALALALLAAGGWMMRRQRHQLSR